MKKMMVWMLALTLLTLTLTACSGGTEPISSLPDSFTASSSEPTSSVSGFDSASTDASNSSATENLTGTPTVGEDAGTTATAKKTTAAQKNTTTKKSTTTTTQKPTTTTKKPSEPVAATNLTWDFMQKKGGAETEALAMRKAITQSVDTIKATGTTYYFSENGDDTNDGTSPQTALKSLYRIARLSLKAGDAVLFERGSTFRTDEQIAWVNGVSYGAYGSGNKPEILGSIRNYGGTSGLWTKHNGNVWKVGYQYSDAGSVIVNDGEIIGNKVFSLDSVKKQGDFYSEAGAVYFYCETDPNKFESIEIPCGGNLMGSTNPKNIVVENICFKYAGTHGIGTVGGDNVTIRNCVFGWIGGQRWRSAIDNTRLGNAIEFYNGASNIVVENNWIYQVYDTGITFQGDNGPFKNIRFSNNLIEYTVMGIEFWCKNHDDDMTGIVFEGNNLRFTNYGWGAMPLRGERGAHIYFSWAAESAYKNLQVSIKNNIFDCSYSYILQIPWHEDAGYTGKMDITLEGNSYYQRNHLGNSDPGYGGSANHAMYYGNNPKHTNANNQSELETAVKAAEPNAKVIKWLK